MRRQSRHGPRTRGARERSARRRRAVAAAATRPRRRTRSIVASRPAGSTAFIAGCYAVGHTALKAEGRWMAAVLALGGDAVLSHATAAGAWDLRRRGSGAIHVTVPSTAGRKRRRGIRLHRSGTLTPTRHDDAPRHPDHHPRPHDRRPRPHPRRPPPRARARPRGPTQPHRLRRPETTPHPALLTSGVVPVQRRRNTNPQRDGGAVPRALRRTTESRRPKVNTRIEGEEVDFVWRDATTDRRGRRLRLPPLAARPSNPTANATSCSSSQAGA